MDEDNRCPECGKLVDYRSPSPPFCSEECERKTRERDFAETGG